MRGGVRLLDRPECRCTRGGLPLAWFSEVRMLVGPVDLSRFLKLSRFLNSPLHG
jgi:hypothetical protein